MILQRITCPHLCLSAQHFIPNQSSISWALNHGPKVLISEVTPLPQTLISFSLIHRCWASWHLLFLGPDSVPVGLSSFITPPAPTGSWNLSYKHCTQLSVELSPQGRRPPLSISHLPGLVGGQVLGPQRPLLTGTHSYPHCHHGPGPGLLVSVLLPRVRPSPRLCNSQSVPLPSGLGSGHSSVPHSSPCKCCFGQESPCKGDVDNHVQSHHSYCCSAACTEETESFSYSNKSM